jgi:hypothetical protein
MTLPDQIPPEKDTTWMWVVGAVVVLCLCCGMLAVVAGGYFVITKRGLSLPGFTIPSPTQASRPVGTPTAVPPAGGEATALPAPMSVQPYDPSSGQYQTLQNLAPNWQGLTAPGTNTWKVQVSASEPVAIFMGWCAIDQKTLNTNYQHLTWKAVVDGSDVPPSSLFNASYSDPQQGECQSYSGLIRSWTVGQHTIKITMHVDQGINDGWNPYAAGDYTDIYQITVTP